MKKLVVEIGSVHFAATLFAPEEWVALPDVANFLADTQEDCPECLGDGQHECECGDVHECANCGGTGKLIDHGDIYHRRLSWEKARLTEWLLGYPRPGKDNGPTDPLNEIVSSEEYEQYYHHPAIVSLDIQAGPENPS